MLKKKLEPCVGIVFLVGDELFVESTPLSEAGVYAGHRIHERGHPDLWAELGLDKDYDEHPRGRCQYNSRTGQWSLLLDRCIARRPEIVKSILKRLNLPVNTQVALDEHYVCPGCMRND